MITGTEIFAEACGCSVHRTKDNMPCAIPCINNIHEAGKIKVPRLFDSSLAYLFNIADKVYKEAGSDATLRLIDLQTPFDIAAMLWDKTDFYLSLITETETVLELCSKIMELFFSFIDEWFRRYPIDFVAHYPSYYMPSGITVSADEVGVISPKLFNEFFLNELTEISNRYGQIGIHCCAASEYQWSNFKKIPNITMLNLNRPITSHMDSVEYFKDFTALMPILYDHNDFLTSHKSVEIKYPEDAFTALTAIVESKGEALKLLEQWKRNE